MIVTPVSEAKKAPAPKADPKAKANPDSNDVDEEAGEEAEVDPMEVPAVPESGSFKWKNVPEGGRVRLGLNHLRGVLLGLPDPGQHKAGDQKREPERREARRYQVEGRFAGRRDRALPEEQGEGRW